MKDKTFFFGAYEGVEQHRSNTTSIHRAVGRFARRRGIRDPAVPATSGRWLRPARRSSTGTQTFATTGLLNLHENYATARVDHHFSESDTISGSWLFDRGPYTQPDPLLDVTSSLFSFRQMYDVEETHIFSPTLVNTARFGYSRSHGINGGVVGAINPIAADTSLGVRPGIPAPIITLSSGELTSTSSVGSASQNLLVSNSFQFYDDAFWTHGKHSFKFGVAVERIQFNAADPAAAEWAIYVHQPAEFPRTIIPSKVQELQAGNAFEVGSRNTAMGFYAQDDWKFETNLSINIGLALRAGYGSHRSLTTASRS